jgi:ribosomal protein S18 acetylase RimI-like enzyme
VDVHIVIRKALPQDAHELAQIERRCFDPAIYGHLLSKAEFTRLTTRVRSAVIVAEVNGKVAGYAAVIFLRPKRLTWFFSLAVDREYQGIGAATCLFRGAEEQAVANGCPCMILEIRQNKALFWRYTRYGYTVLKEMLGFYPDGGVAIRMCKQLAAVDTAGVTQDSSPELATV